MNLVTVLRIFGIGLSKVVFEFGFILLLDILINLILIILWYWIFIISILIISSLTLLGICLLITFPWEILFTKWNNYLFMTKFNLVFFDFYFQEFNHILIFFDKFFTCDVLIFKTLDLLVQLICFFIYLLVINL